MRTVVYAPPLALDLHVPDDPVALCVYLHGGGWRAGDRTTVPAPGFFETITGTGLAVASIDYRLSGEASFPAQMDDVLAALHFLDRRRSAFGIATPRTVAWGVSAGGHLAALAALRKPAAGLEKVVCWYAPTDLSALADDIDAAGGTGDRSATSREGALLGGRLDLAAAASPVTYAHGGAPPFLFLHGDADTAVPPRQSHRLAGALRAAGVPATVEIVPGAGHMLPELPPDEILKLAERSAAFLQ
ncbi:hypothetical protein ACTI_52460 [Actinoplanes sp. OR16]|uniref:alpha/beta hydrolase n=1 Tax=Actinoplanes sp. OR16 TaxID=946334 RepID=UPI000F6D4814|nr:alpha/beta hydrolase [Actinoplanes sp. OR16]BBH68561.1 hypothetical protein ACTI_52460 [Actinoplanes sp. OR16]